jgi:hypothetical protein
MAIEYERNIITSGYNLAKVNDNFTKIEDALVDGLSRTGQGPNQMEVDLDMNSQDLLNVKNLDVQFITYQGEELAPTEFIVSNALLKPQYDPDNIGGNIYDRKYQGDYNTEDDFTSASPPAVIMYTTTGGYETLGDGFGHAKRRISTPFPVEAWHSQAANGSWWEIIPVDYFHAGWIGVKSGDNTTDYMPLIYQAMRAAAHFGVRRVILPDGIIYCSTQFTPISNVEVDGRDVSILNFSNLSTSTDVFGGGPGAFGTTRVVFSDSLKNQSFVNITAHGYVAGDWIRLTSTLDSMTSAANEDRLGDRADILMLSETRQVRAVVNANQIELTRPLRYSYPTNSTARKITPLQSFSLKRLEIDMDGGGSTMGYLTLGNDLVVEGCTFRNLKDALHIRGAFGDSSVSDNKFYGDRSIDVFTGPTNLQHLKPCDGCMFLKAQNNRFEWGGQVVDITYTPTNVDHRAPCIGVDISFSSAYDTSLSAFTDHPGNDGNIMNNMYGEGVTGLVYIRSRRAQSYNIIGYGRGSTGSGIGLWLGESGYFNGASAGNVKMYNFGTGVSISGQGDTIGRRDVIIDDVQVEYCNVGLNVGPTTTTSDNCGTIINNLRTANITTTHVTINGSNSGLNLINFTLRGPVTTAGIAISTIGPKYMKIVGEVIDLGLTIPTLTNGTTTNAIGNKVRIDRRGDCGSNTGINRKMFELDERSLYGFDGSTSAITGTTTETDIISEVYVLPKGSFDASGRLTLVLYGNVTGTANTKTIRLRVGTSLLGIATLPALASGTFRVEFVVAGTAIDAQGVYSRFEVDGVSVPDPVGRTGRTVNLNSGGVINITAQLANAADSVTLYSAELTGSWA